MNNAAAKHTTTNPIAHGLRGLSCTTAEIPTDPARTAEWMRAWSEALDEGIRINSTEGIDALTRAIVDEERAAELEAALDAANDAHDAARERLAALESAKKTLSALEYIENDDVLTVEDKTVLSACYTSKTYIYLTGQIKATKAEALRLETVAYEASQALTAYEEEA